MNYIEYTFEASPKDPATDILIAELGAAGFESFEETENGVLAYIQEPEWKPELLEDIEILSNTNFNITYAYKRIEQQNWNATWEKNFTPIIVDGLCMVRAPFHELIDVKYSIEIEPKMSFGTGHHETTHMMIQHILNTDLANKSVLDMGCGTSVLAILAELKGAKPIDAIDIDSWCYENSLENIKRNNCNHIKVALGNKAQIKSNYDCIIANINRNILLEDISAYAAHLNPKGNLFLSGFYEADIPVILKEAHKYNLHLNKTLKRNNWVALKLIN